MTANAAVTRAIASRASPTILVDNSFPSGDRIAHGDDILFPKRSSFSRSITLWSAELREPTPGHSSGGPRLLEELEMDLDEVRAVRPQGRLALAANRLLILNEEPRIESRSTMMNRALSVHAPQRTNFAPAGHEHVVRLSTSAASRAFTPRRIAARRTSLIPARYVPAQADPLERLRGLRQFHRRPIGLQSTN